jgi:hypothetical protein
LFLNLENFSLFKLRSTMFLIDFPMNFLIRMMDIWGKIIPQTMSSQEYTKEEQGMVNTVKQTIKEFRLNLVDYFTHLSEYIVSVRAEQPPVHNYTLIKESPVYTKLRAAFKQSPNTFLVQSYVEALFKNTFNKIKEDFDALLATVLAKIDERLKIIKLLIEQSKPKKTSPF